MLVDGATNFSQARVPKSRTRNDMELVPQHPFSLQKSSRVNVSQKRLDELHHEHELEAEKSPLRQRERELAAERQKTRTEMARRRASTALNSAAATGPVTTGHPDCPLLPAVGPDESVATFAMA